MAGRVSEKHLLWLYGRKLEQWQRATTDQWVALTEAMRVLNKAAQERGSVASGEWEFDRLFTQAHLLIVCMRHIWRFAVLISQMTASDEIVLAVKEFEARVPHVKDMRDFLEHFDDYAASRGRKTVPKSEDLGGLSHDTDDPIQSLSYSFGGYELPLHESFEASRRLATRVTEIMRSQPPSS